jgi:mRNA interferase RelE/StbE
MTYAVELGPVRKDLRALDDKTRRRILRALIALEANPRPPGAKKLRGESELWRVRVGDYRILYSIEEARLVVLVVKIGHRRGGLSRRAIGTVARLPHSPREADHARRLQWLVEQIDRLDVRRPIHLRGLHYILASSADAVRPNGQTYINDEPCWNWLDPVAKAARWLGYIDWSDIKDERNEPHRVCRRPFGLSPTRRSGRPQAVRSSGLQPRRATCCRWAREAGDC